MKDLQIEDYDALAAFRYAIRKFLRFSKDLLEARAKLTPEQYEALLAVKVGGGPPGITVKELSERLQVNHHTAVSLIDKLAARELLIRCRGRHDRRVVNISLTDSGNSVLASLAEVHREEMRHRSPEIIAALKRLQK